MARTAGVVVDEGRDGLRVAKLFRDARGLLQTRACDVEQICADFEIVIEESRLADPGYTACLQRCDDNSCGLFAGEVIRGGREEARCEQ